MKRLICICLVVLMMGILFACEITVDLPSDKEPPKQEVPGDETPGEEIPNEEKPGEEISGNEIPNEEISGDETPGEEMPGEEIPDEDDQGLSATTNEPMRPPYLMEYSSDKSKIKIGEDLKVNLRFIIEHFDFGYSDAISMSAIFVMRHKSNQSKEAVIEEIENLEDKSEWQWEVVVPSDWFCDEEGIIIWVLSFLPNRPLGSPELEIERGIAICLFYIVEGDTIKLFDSEFKYNRYKYPDQYVDKEDSDELVFY